MYSSIAQITSFLYSIFVIEWNISMDVHKSQAIKSFFSLVDLNRVFKIQSELNILSAVAVEIGKTKSSFNRM